MNIQDLRKIRVELSSAKIVKEGFPIPSPEKGEDKKAFITRCMKAIGGENKPEEQKLAICYAQIEHKHKMEDKNPCWKGYQQVGEKMLRGKMVPNCVPIKKKK